MYRQFLAFIQIFVSGQVLGVKIIVLIITLATPTSNFSSGE